jgi:hypothetical protein
MIKLTFPDEKPKLKNSDRQTLVFCAIRKKWLILTPEEWVRQNIILYLSLSKNFPLSLFSIEKQILVNEQQKRIDLAIYYNNQPLFLVECKKMEQPLNQAALSQSLSYLSKLNAKYLIITNAVQTFCFINQNNQMLEMNEIPNWTDVVL